MAPGESSRRIEEEDEDEEEEEEEERGQAADCGDVDRRP